MRCNRKTTCFAVTPRRKMVIVLNITEVRQLYRRKKAKMEITGTRYLKLIHNKILSTNSEKKQVTNNLRKLLRCAQTVARVAIYPPLEITA